MSNIEINDTDDIDELINMANFAMNTNSNNNLEIKSIEKVESIEKPNIVKKDLPFKLINNLTEKEIDFAEHIFYLTADVFGENNVDILFEDRQKTGILFDLVIHFKRITIKNSLDFKHIIRDLYVKFCFDDVNKIKTDLKGARTTFTNKEYASQYGHSHLPATSKNGTYQTFCLGYDSFRASLYELHKDFTFIKFQVFLYELDQYIKWESIEGGPYRFIKDIGKTNEISRGSSIDASKDNYLVINQILNNLNDWGIIQSKNVVTNCDMFYINSERLENSISNYLNSNLDFVKNTIFKNMDKLTNNFLVKKINNSYYSIEEIKNSENVRVSNLNNFIANNKNDFNGKPVYFKNERVTLKIYKDLDDNNLQNFLYYLHPRLLNEISIYLNNLINEYYEQACKKNN